MRKRMGINIKPSVVPSSRLEVELGFGVGVGFGFVVCIKGGGEGMKERMDDPCQAERSIRST
jgi:hypothetical protein